MTAGGREFQVAGAVQVKIVCRCRMVNGTSRRRNTEVPIPKGRLIWLGHKV